eukprot:m.465654 g.465654  ORF g.465654 m.465654 type:complete len:252 (-) comp24416_c0_seq1:129-884(-)
MMLGDNTAETEVRVRPNGSFTLVNPDFYRNIVGGQNQSSLNPTSTSSDSTPLRAHEILTRLPHVFRNATVGEVESKGPRLGTRGFLSILGIGGMLFIAATGIIIFGQMIKPGHRMAMVGVCVYVAALVLIAIGSAGKWMTKRLEAKKIDEGLVMVQRELDRHNREYPELKFEISQRTWETTERKFVSEGSGGAYQTVPKKVTAVILSVRNTGSETGTSPNLGSQTTEKSSPPPIPNSEGSDTLREPLLSSA